MRGAKHSLGLLAIALIYFAAQWLGLIQPNHQAPHQRPADPAKPATQTQTVRNTTGDVPESWGRDGTLADHFNRHGHDVGARTAEEYVEKAAQFRKRALAGELEMKRSSDGVLRVFDPQTNLFAAYNRDGTTKTFFRCHGQDYFDRQPGQPVKPSDLR